MRPMAKKATRTMMPRIKTVETSAPNSIRASCGCRELKQLGFGILDRLEAPAAKVPHQQHAGAGGKGLISFLRLHHDVVRRAVLVADARLRRLAGARGPDHDRADPADQAG